MKIPNFGIHAVFASISLARIVSEDSQLIALQGCLDNKSSKDS